MNKSTLALLLLGLIALAAVVPTFAQDEAEEEKTEQATEKQAYEREDEDEEHAVYNPHEDVETTFLFKDTTDRKLKLGAVNTLLIHLRNKGSGEFNVSYIGGSLHSPTEYSYYIQNFSVFTMPAGTTLGPNEEITLEYMFQPDEKLHPVDVWMSSWVMYNQTAEIYRSTAYNNTVTLTEERGVFDSRSLFSLFLAAAAAGLVAYIFRGVDNKVKSQKKTAAVETGTVQAAPSVKIYKPAALSTPVGKKKPYSPKKKN